MELKQIAEKIISFAPTIATALGSPYAGIAIKILSTALGVNVDGLESTLTNLSSDDQIKIKQLEEEFAVLQLKVSTSEADTQNARQKQLEEEKMGIKDYMPQIITVFMMVSFTIIVILLFTKSIDITNSTMLGSMVGLLTREFIQACRYYLGEEDAN